MFYLIIIPRLIKEVAHYRKEVTENESKWKQVEADPTKDEYDAKRFRDIWEESVRMVPDSERRLQAAREDLSTLVQTHFSAEHEENEWLPVAREIVGSGEETIVNNGNKDRQDKIGGAGGEVTNVDDLAEGEAF